MSRPSFTDIARALEQQEYLLACDFARLALQDPGARTIAETADIRIALARALTRLGHFSEARSELEAGLKGSAPIEPALRGRVLVEMADIVRLEAEAETTRAARAAKAEEALGLYREALALDPDRPDILVRAAGVSLTLAGAASTAADAHEMARRVLQLTDAPDASGFSRTGVPVESGFSRTGGFSRTRHRADALSILGRVDEAARTYESLTSQGGTTADLADARFEASIIAAATGRPRDLFKRAFPPLQLIVFAGHLPDRAGGPVRFPHDAVAGVRDAIGKVLAEQQASVGLASAAAGADLLFVDVLANRPGSAIHLVLPWSRHEFRRTSVTPFEPPGAPVWAPLFDRALERAASVREVGQIFEPGGDVGWQYANEVTAGIALHIARASRLDLQPLALWDGQPSRGIGGTSAFHDLWAHQLQVEPIVLSPPAVPAPPAARAAANRTERPVLRQEVKSLLFADIVGYSRITERAVGGFVTTFLGSISGLLSSSRHAPCHVNTWGDALFAVFDFTHDAGLFALDLIRLVEENRDEWLRHGLSWEERAASGEPAIRTLSIRIGLHAGPVVMHHEPIARRIGFTGAHVTRAARIEPIARPGEVYASEEFAALAEFDAAMRRAGAAGTGPAAAREFVCLFAGTMPLAKDYPGRHHIYRVLPTVTLELEELAKAIHEEYCATANAAGTRIEKSSTLVPWDELGDDHRDANRAQAADIPAKLRALGWEVTAGAGSAPATLTMTDEQVERLAVREHDRWMSERRRQGWTHAPVRDDARRHHPSIVPWEALSRAEREKDRNAVRNLGRLVERAGLRLRRLG
jgi:class 3 adenylate cyclase